MQQLFLCADDSVHLPKVQMPSRATLVRPVAIFPEKPEKRHFAIRMVESRSNREFSSDKALARPVAIFPEKSGKRRFAIRMVENRSNREFSSGKALARPVVIILEKPEIRYFAICTSENGLDRVISFSRRHTSCAAQRLFSREYCPFAISCFPEGDNRESSF